jgi:hypothetical protein
MHEVDVQTVSNSKHQKGWQDTVDRSIAEELDC